MRSRPSPIRAIRHAHLFWATLAVVSLPGGIAASPQVPTPYALQGGAGEANLDTRTRLPNPQGSVAGTLAPIGIAEGARPSRPAQQSYTFRETDFARHRPTELWDISKSGAAVGNFADGRKSAPDHCFLLDHGRKSRIDRPGASSTQCQGINKQGAIVGGYMVPNNSLSTGFVYANGTFHTVLPPGAFDAVVNAINDAGMMVGNCFDPNGGHGFIYDGRHYWLIDAPGALITSGEGINNKGEIVATALLKGDDHHVFLIHGERFKEVRFPDSRDNQGWHINNRGEVGVDWTDVTGVQHGGVYDGARDAYYVVDVPGMMNTAILGINDEGTLVGTFQERPDRPNHGFIAAGALGARQ